MSQRLGRSRCLQDTINKLISWNYNLPVNSFQVADDPETLRIKANTKIISNVAYHGELEKKAQMEKQRQINENGELVGECAMDLVQLGMVNGYVDTFVLFVVSTPWYQ